MSQYDKFAKEYIAMRSNMFDQNMNAEFPEMLQLLGDIKSQKLLDLGCGFGDYVKIYSKKGAIVTAVDNSEKEIEHAQKLNIPNAKFIVSDISKKFPFKDSSFDIITSSLVFDHLEDLIYLFQECNRVLKNKGIMVFSVSNPVFYQEKSIVGKIKILGKKIIFGNYFERRKIVRKWGGTATMEHYHKPLEDYFSAFLENGFELLSFKEPQSKTEKITWHCKNPTFLVFKLKKSYIANKPK
ncbi:class I SAM-dependent methyltransferase [Candidatus Woesearchaeota archaeon]|jgi:ubiquinone/menaquinone biosynthesis C-methylase UbiE|nr:class I SAM-dependent methyltransferase [Candidatus Woesearchaeota archaeon]MBT4595755.1 class I SAM-dependent methyltransferase [Candidatus Woesearchaeota archaeon]MBT5741396.1 class I SAM-dependent methyltransferase [Candidatus Woesearchaeota archaeon]MBT6505218.1 class I SAM-dependent methyltransferase [Candidatus Woesearchaeota archaeon]MBT7296098.1 class I SAM-dependent methyltransferase [Candidatus Woesearchaeota archaeon]